MSAQEDAAPLLRVHYSDVCQGAWRRRIDDVIRQVLGEIQAAGGTVSPSSYTVVEYHPGFCLDRGPVASDGAIGQNEDLFIPLYTRPSGDAVGDSPSTPQPRFNKSACFNCGEQGHTVSECTQPLDQKDVSTRRKAWMESRDSAPVTAGR